MKKIVLNKIIICDVTEIILGENIYQYIENNVKTIIKRKKIIYCFYYLIYINFQTNINLDEYNSFK